MRKVSLVAVIAVACVVVFGRTALAQSANPAVGTWKLNVAKSKYVAGTPNKSGTTQIEAAGAGVKVTVDSVGGDGTKRHWTYTANADGKDVRVLDAYGKTSHYAWRDGKTPPNLFDPARGY